MTYPLASGVELVVWTSASWTTNIPRDVYSYAVASVVWSGGNDSSGFDPISIVASYDPVTNLLSNWKTGN